MARKIEIDISGLEDYSPKHHYIDILKRLLREYRDLRILAIASASKIFIVDKDTRDEMVEKTLMRMRDAEIERTAEEIAKRLERRHRKEVIMIILRETYGTAIAWAIRRDEK